MPGEVAARKHPQQHQRGHQREHIRQQAHDAQSQRTAAVEETDYGECHAETPERERDRAVDRHVAKRPDHLEKNKHAGCTEEQRKGTERVRDGLDLCEVSRSRS